MHGDGGEGTNTTVPVSAHDTAMVVGSLATPPPAGGPFHRLLGTVGKRLAVLPGKRTCIIYYINRINR